MSNTIEENKSIFIQLLKDKVRRDGIDDLIDYLEKSDFFIAPASARYHCDHEGGLVEHSINVYNRLTNIIKNEYGNFEKYSEETIAICGLLHDLCKIDFYKIDYRNVKENGEWVKKPYYSVDEKLPYGHEEKSVYIINGFIRLTREEALAINWHMGGFDYRVLGGATALSESCRKFPLCIWMHIADLTATYIDENSNLIVKKGD